MSYKQVKTYLQNEDFSAISFQKFSDGQTEKFPTYTFCFEDSSIQQMYYKEHISTSFEFVGRYGSKKCPYGCLAKIHEEKLRLLNRTYDDQNLLYDMEDGDENMPSFNSHDYTFNHGLMENDLKEPSMENDYYEKPRYKRSMDIYEESSDGYFGLSIGGKEVVLLNDEEKTYMIAPQQYQNLLMGFNQSITYAFDTPNYWSPLLETSIGHDEVKIDYSIETLKNFDFNQSIIDLGEILLGFKVHMENGSTYGWNSNAYEKLETFCKAREFPHGHAGMDCNVEDAFRNELQRMGPSEYPFEKVYQDPLKICYSPKTLPGSYRKTEHMTLDLQKMFLCEEMSRNFCPKMFRIQSSLPFMKMFIHMQGQFIRKLGKESARYIANDVLPFCKNLPLFIGKKYPYNETDDCSGTLIELDISQVTLLKSRHDSKTACNDRLEDEDPKIIEKLIRNEKLNCTPSYWKGFETTKLYNICTDLLEYKYISTQTTNFTNYEKIRKEMEPPCNEMIIVTNMQIRKGRRVQWTDFNNDGKVDEDEVGLYLDVKFDNANDRYQVIENSRGFSGESCWAGIGGFFGIFVGVSLMQLPEIVLDLYVFLKKKVF